MTPVEYIKHTREHFAKLGFPPYRWTENPDCSQWTPLQKLLERCRVALLSSGGIYIKDEQPPFNPDRDDLTFREIPNDVERETLAISHDNYDHTDAMKDINCMFPIDRLRELDAQGIIGEFAATTYTIRWGESSAAPPWNKRRPLRSCRGSGMPRWMSFSWFPPDQSAIRPLV